jgi:hypothetical protein
LIAYEILNLELNSKISIISEFLKGGLGRGVMAYVSHGQVNYYRISKCNWDQTRRNGQWTDLNWDRNDCGNIVAMEMCVLSIIAKAAYVCHFRRDDGNPCTTDTCNSGTWQRISNCGEGFTCNVYGECVPG